MIDRTDDTETERLYKKTLAINEELLVGSVRQHELTEAAESLNARLRVEIAARQAATRELAEKARLLDLSFDAIIVRDMEGHIRYWNHGAEELYGWPRETALGQLSHVLLQTKFAMPIEQMTAELHRDNRWTGELVHTKRDGGQITVLTRKTLDRDSEGNPSTVLEYITDITERKGMEEALREAQTRLAAHAGQLEALVTERTAELRVTNQQLESFAYSIAHDLRSPLRSMQGFSTLLVAEANTALSVTGRDYAARISKAAQFMDALLIDLLSFSRVNQQRVELTSVSLEKVVESVLSRLEEDIQEAGARVDGAGPWPSVLAHEWTLTQVLFNLIGNALKFVAPDVPPQIRLRAEERMEGFSGQASINPTAHSSTHPPPPLAWIRIWVEDNGPGIAPDHQAQIFRLFTRLEGDKYAGTGAGLAIVQKGVERMGGRVGVESIPSKGSQFWFELRKA